MDGLDPSPKFVSASIGTPCSLKHCLIDNDMVKICMKFRGKLKGT